MSLNIKNERTHALVRELATLSGMSQTEAVEDAVNLRGFDEVIISTLSPRLSKWLHLDLPSKISGLGLPVTTVTPVDG